MPSMRRSVITSSGGVAVIAARPDSPDSAVVTA